LAKIGWLAPIVAVASIYLIRQSAGPSSVQGPVIAVLASLLYAAGFVAAAVALVRSVGSRQGRTIASAVLGLVASGGLLAVTASSVVTSARKKTPQARLEALAAELGRTVPRTLDTGTEFSKVEALAGQLVFTYTFSSHRLEDIDIPVFEENIRPILRDGVCENLEFLWSNGFDLVIDYSSSDHQHVTTVQFSAADCR